MTLFFVGVRILRVVKHVLNKPSMLPDPTVRNDARSQCRGKFSIDPLNPAVHLIKLLGMKFTNKTYTPRKNEHRTQKMSVRKDDAPFPLGAFKSGSMFIFYCNGCEFSPF